MVGSLVKRAKLTAPKAAVSKAGDLCENHQWRTVPILNRKSPCYSQHAHRSWLQECSGDDEMTKLRILVLNRRERCWHSFSSKFIFHQQYRPSGPEPVSNYPLLSPTSLSRFSTLPKKRGTCTNSTETSRRWDGTARWQADASASRSRFSANSESCT